MPSLSQAHLPDRWNRRTWIRSLMGGSLFLPAILQDLMADSRPPARLADPLAPRPSHYPAKAKRVILLYMTGGVSHIDTFDPKPAGDGRDGSGKDKLMGCVFPTGRDPRTGVETSDLFPRVRSCMEDICLIRSMQSAHFDHSEATLGMLTGSATFARPSFGSWVSYGLGTESRNLPSFVVIAPHLPYGGTQVYGNDFLPAHHQGLRVVPGADPVANLKRRTEVAALQSLELGLADRLNEAHLEQRGGNADLAARIRSFETAWRMQEKGAEVFDLARETDATLGLYGLERGQVAGFGWQCLVARRLAERGVRFIELIDTGSRPNWDSHGDMKEHVSLARNVDRPIAGLIRDLKSRGMLEDTVILWTTEFGRTPHKEGKFGRGHHGKCYSTWLCGGGVRGGMVQGETNDIGSEIVSGKVDVHDLHATVLHLLGLDHERLTYRHGGRDFRLTDVFGSVRRELLA